MKGMARKPLNESKYVSVIIPCYLTRQQWIRRIFEDMERQTIGFHNLELVLVVDASPDDTFERLKEYERRHEEDVVLVNSADKIGPGGASSLGIQYASGKYVAFMDQDDWVEPCMYAHLYEKAEEYGCDMVESYATRDAEYMDGTYDGQGVLDDDERDGKDGGRHEAMSDALGMDGGIYPRRTGAEDAFYEFSTPDDRKRYFAKDRPERRKYWAKLYRRDFLLDNRLDFPANVRYDDNYFKGMTCYHAWRVYVLEEYLYHWMVNPHSVSMENDFSAHLDRMKVELLKLEEFERRGLLPICHDEMEYIFLEQFFANTFQTISTRNGTMPMPLLSYMGKTVRTRFPNYRANPYIASRMPPWAMGEWIENALSGIRQVRGVVAEPPAAVLKKSPRCQS